MNSIPLSNRKYSTLRYLTHELKSTVLGGTPPFIQKYMIVFLEKKKCSIKMLPQMVLQTENNIFLNFVSLVMLLRSNCENKQIFLGPDRSSYPITFIKNKLFSD